MANLDWLSVSVIGRCLVALSMIGATFVTSRRLIAILLPRVGLPLRWSSVLCLGMWLATEGFHLLLALGGFNLILGWLGSMALGAWVLRGEPERAATSAQLRRDLRSGRRALRLAARGPHAIINGVLFAAAALYFIRALIVPPLGWDWFTYHGPRAASWLQSTQFTFSDGPGPLGYYRNFFAGAEILVAWAMLPFGSDLLANVSLFAEWFTLGVSVWALARALGLREPYASTAAGVTMFASTMQLELNTGYVEIPLNALLCHGAALAIWSWRRPSLAATALSGMSVGAAIGTKITAAPVGALVLLVVMGCILRARGVSALSKLQWAALSTIGATLPVAPWLINAWRTTGYPLSPMPVIVLGLRLGVAHPTLTWLQWRPGLPQHQWGPELDALRIVFSSLGNPATEALGALALVPFAFGPIGAVALARRAPLFAALLTALTVLPILLHFSASMSAIRLVWPANSSRHLLTGLTFAIVMSLAWCRHVPRIGRIYRWLLLSYPVAYSVVYARWGWGGWETPDAVAVGFAIAVGAAAVTLAFEFGKLLGAALLLFSLTLGCSALQARRDQTRQLAFEQSFALHASNRSWTSAVPLVDDPDVRHRIAITAGENQHADTWFIYPFLGRRFQNTLTYVTPTGDGGIPVFGPFGDLRPRARFEPWLNRLTKKGIQEVISFGPRSIEQSWMDERPSLFTKLAGDGEWGLYALRFSEPHK